MYLSLFLKGGGELKQTWGPPREKGRAGQEKAVSHPARSLTAPPPCPDAREEREGAALSWVLRGRECRNSPGQGRTSPLSPSFTLSPRTQWTPGETHFIGCERREDDPFKARARFPAPSSRLARTASRARGGDLFSLSPRSAAVPGRSLPRPAPTLWELQLQLRQLRPHFGRQRRHRGGRGLQASLRHPGSASHTPEDKRWGRRRDGLTRAHTPATGSGSGRRAPPLPLPPPPPWAKVTWARRPRPRAEDAPPPRPYQPEDSRAYGALYWASPETTTPTPTPGTLLGDVSWRCWWPEPT